MKKDRTMLHVIVQGRHIRVTPALREYAEEKLGRIGRYFDQVHEAQVVLSVERRGDLGRAQVAEVTVHGDGVVLRGQEASSDMYASIDVVAEKLKKQIAKYRSKVIDRGRIAESRKKTAQIAASRRALRRPDVQESPVVRVKRFAMKPMTAEDAALQMELLGHDFFVFRNAATMEVNVVYRRAAGNYGVIEPEA